MESLIDLHTHSYISDGSSSPSEVVQAAFKNNLKAIALTDHDSIYGIKEAIMAAKKYNIKIINGIEITSLYRDKRLLHILGLGIDINNKEFLQLYTKIKKARELSVPKILKYIKDTQKININIDDLYKSKYDEYISRYDIYRYILENKICTDPQKVWNIYLDPIPYEENELIPAEESIRIINKAGGMSFLAHYNKKIGLGGLNNTEIENNIAYLVSKGLNGVERYYPSFTKSDYEFLDYLISKYNLYYSGGTDYHGSNRNNIDIGVGDGTLRIPYSILKFIKH